ncbi:hypothetical protein TNCV_3863571 [Trichonephila clavipes]|uniref:Tc1-like transposase DDE domain-containing protein n=1 Tax=Trichonephila clavipes TaxID=2585209 RepID=A0A8X6VFJ9_TRICX|nr:hypothetical protein TNCV_3863571 [Trichonephila clavipes]
MDDNARSHRTLPVEELLESEDITRMDWSAYSPDLNPIEHVVSLQTDHLIETSAHAPQRSMIKYTGMDTLRPGPHWLYRH